MASDPDWKAQRYRAMENRRLIREFGITIDERDAMEAAQDGRCAICGEPPRSRVHLSIDHDHQTKVVRGLLCRRCNYRLLGIIEKDLGLTMKALRYLGFEVHGVHGHWETAHRDKEREYLASHYPPSKEEA